MPFAIIFIALILIVTGFKGTTGTLTANITQDAKEIFVPVIAIFVIGAIGYIPGLKKVSDGFLALILLAMFLSNRGFFSKFNQAIRNPLPASSPDTQGSVTQGIPQLSPLQPIPTIDAYQ